MSVEQTKRGQKPSGGSIFDAFRWLIEHSQKILLFSLSLGSLCSAPLSFTGQATGLGRKSPFQSNADQEFGLQYIPVISLGKESALGALFDMELSFDIHYSNTRDVLVAKPYRGWLRYKTEALEIRAGVQKLNFGTGKLFRSLQWFDALDPIDPLQLTPGVQALRLRYELNNTSNLTTWLINAEGGKRGLDLFNSKKNTQEFGGRYQALIGNLELALTTHYRQLELESNEQQPEYRLALDGSWDLGAGMWFEATVIVTEPQSELPENQQMITGGVDYTFGIGNGLYGALEGFRYASRGPDFNSVSTTQIGALFIYPVSILDNISLFSFFNPDNDQVFNFINWRRTYDNFTIDAGLMTLDKVTGYQLLFTFYH